MHKAWLHPIRLFRVLNGLSQHDLGREVGHCQSWVSEVERRRIQPSDAALDRLASVYGVEVDALREDTAP